MESETHEKQAPLWKDRLELGAKAIVGFLAASYALGLIIVNSHLAQYGLALFSLLEVQYVIVGIGAWIVIALSTWVAFLVVDHIDNAAKRYWSEDKKGYAVTSTLVRITLGLFLLAAVINRVTGGQLEYLRALALGGEFLFLSFWAYLLGSGFWGATQAMKKNQILASGQFFQVVSNYGVPILLVTLYIHSVYPKQSRILGGMPNQEIQVVVKEEALLASLGIKGDEDRLSSPLKLLLETSDFLVVLPQVPMRHMKVTAIKIRTDAVEVILYGDPR